MMLKKHVTAGVACRSGDVAVVPTPLQQRVTACRRVALPACKGQAGPEAKQERPAAADGLLKKLGTVAASVIIAAAAIATPPPALADLVQTVPVTQITQMAKPLPKQQIDKGKVWLVFIGGAASLFVTTVLAENNGAWFPAIARANAAMAKSRKISEQAENVAADTGIETSAKTVTPSQLPPPAAAAAPPAAAKPSAPQQQQQASSASSHPAASAASAVLSEVSTAELEAELQRQSKLVEEGLLAARKKVLEQPKAAAEVSPQGHSTTSNVVSSNGVSSSNGASSSSGETSGATGSSTAVVEAAADPPSSSHSGSSAAAAATGYTVVAESAAVAPEGVAWVGPSVAAAAGEAEQQETELGEAQQTAAADAPAPAAELAGVLEGRELLQQYKQQQQEVRQ